MWRRLLRTVHNGDIQTLTLECQEWHDRNLLYLTEEARFAFSMAYTAARDHREIREWRDQPEEIKANWARIRDAGDIILAAVALPPLTDAERNGYSDAPAQTEPGSVRTQV